MTALIRWTDALLVSVKNSPAGANWFDVRSEWFGTSAITFGDGGLANTLWYQDQGPIGMAADLLEPRAFCVRGGCSFAFTGETLLLRLNVAWSWFTGATLLIDGAAPSTLGLLTAVDTLSCDAQTYGLTVDSYVDVLVADGLAPGAHVAEILVDNADATKFFSIAGFKQGQIPARPALEHGAFIAASALNLPQNHMLLTLRNQQALPLADILLTFNGAATDATGAPLLTASRASLAAGESFGVTWAPVFAGDEVSDLFDMLVSLDCKYPDPDGLETIPVDLTVLPGSDALTFSPSPWLLDSAGPGGVARLFVTQRSLTGSPWVMSHAFNGDALAVTISRAASWGMLGIYDGPTDGAVLLQSLDCNVDEGGAAHVAALTGFGAGDHTIYFRKTLEDGAPVVFLGSAWTQDGTYTLISEVLDVSFAARQPVAMLPENVIVGPFDATFTNPDPMAADYVSAEVRTNERVTYTETLTRFPTFAVCYQSGFRDVLREYDVLILDPIGAKAADVLYWQSLGIRCYGYISTGEEVGFYADRYDFSSALAPRMDGTGPGGYSKNYMFTTNPGSGPPDKNGVWSSYYMDPRTPAAWLDRILGYYAPQCFGGPVVVTNEEVVTHTATIAAGARIVFDTAQSPIDGDEVITLQTLDGLFTYARFRDYTYDIKTGAFVLSPAIDPPVVSGAHLRISYTRKGHHFDGVFLDTVDTPDVYLGPEFGHEFVPGYSAAFAAMINAMKAAYPDRGMMSNRGFTILPDIIESCDSVMFETWLSAPDDIGDLANTDYHRITDQPSVDYNSSVNRLLQALRARHIFDVYSLNYAKPADVGLKKYIRDMDAQYGYSSWQTVITLTNPNRQTTIDTPHPPVGGTNEFTFYKRQQVLEVAWDEGDAIWDGGGSVWS